MGSHGHEYAYTHGGWKHDTTLTLALTLLRRGTISGSQPDAAIGVVAEALRARVKLDAFSITSFISGFARQGQLSDALAAYQLGRWLDVPPSTVVRILVSVRESEPAEKG